MVSTSQANDTILSQALIDDAMDMRRLLRSRGIEPGDEPPKCDICDTWTATHVVGQSLVCDKPRCQDKVQ